MAKNLYKCLAMYPKEAALRYLYAHSIKQARAVFLRRLANEQGVHPSIVYGYFKEKPESVMIKIEMEVTEHEDERNQ
jgi:hypothetical protein